MQMNDPAPETLAYQPVDSAEPNGAWRLLRLAVVLWATLVLVRHLLYWFPAVLERPTLFLGSQLLSSFGIAVTEAVVLIASIIAAAGCFSARRASWLRTLAIVYIFLTAVPIVVEFVSFGPMRGSNVSLRTAWAIVSKVQLLVVPVLCILAPAMTRTPEDRIDSAAP